MITPLCWNGIMRNKTKVKGMSTCGDMEKLELWHTVGRNIE
jgi:hypothetical protein